ncbi:uroporphyrinogen-III C-methyltransferase [Candidatus Williamhamiltonella defendens]|uniref:uroporphyrinogen-III C-methyltransferase n=1 Tax=Candidatus Williamhamiltonella defendens TaxID=138072 RepID=UPI001F236781|nr:uroporphyrinogen-III C-methyltransferase [Candidatus Hamiltonella defensa]
MQVINPYFIRCSRFNAHSAELLGRLYMKQEKNQITKTDNISTEGLSTSKISQKKTGLLQILLFYSLIIGLSAALYYYAQKQQKENQSLQEEFIRLKKNQENEKKDLKLQLKKQEDALKHLALQTKQSTDKLSKLEKKMANISVDPDQIWCFFEANFFAEMAERKLWRDKDINSAIFFLKIADKNLAKLNQPGLIQVRQALISDISALSALHQVDIDGIILKLNQMSDQINHLPLSVLPEKGDFMKKQLSPVSNSLSEWRKNLQKNWDNFLSSCITVRRRDTKAEPFLSLDQTIYLRENIRSHLLIAAQAAARNQNKIYHQSLGILSTWIHIYFDAKDIHNQLFLEDLKNMQQKDISIQMPEYIKSPALLKKSSHAFIQSPPFSSIEE